MNTETKLETYDEYVARRERALFDERLAKDKYNLEKNRAMLNARQGRFGINRQLSRTHDQLAIIAPEETIVLGANVEAPLNIVRQPEPAENLAVGDHDSALKSEQYDTVNTQKEPLIGLNETVIANPETGDIEKLLHAHFNLGGVYLNEGAHLSATEI